LPESLRSDAGTLYFHVYKLNSVKKFQGKVFAVAIIDRIGNDPRINLSAESHGKPGERLKIWK
jgi:hypothetical protein